MEIIATLEYRFYISRLFHTIAFVLLYELSTLVLMKCKETNT